jgi:hypothetical protein
MRTRAEMIIGAGFAALSLCGTGCNEIHPKYTTSPYHPGPVVGEAVGTGVGAVAGNAAGVAVGFGEGAVRGAAAPFDPTTRVVRRWRTETTPDGRTVQVPEDVLVDSYGRPVGAQPNPRPAQPLASPKNQ